MRRPQAPGTPIDVRRVRRWAREYASYRSAVSEDLVIGWIRQFDADHQDLAARVLDSVDYYSNPRMAALFRDSLNTIPGWHQDVNQRVGKWRFAALSTSAGQSGDSMLHQFRVVNGLAGRGYNELFIHRSEIILEKLGNDDTLVFVDDFVGTGNQVCAAWEEYFRELVADVGKVFLIVVVAQAQGRHRIQLETAMTCVSGSELNESDNIFADQCDCFNAADKTALLGYCTKANRRAPRGFGDCGLVIVFQHRCPNNTIPVLHVENARWTGLFPRHD